MSAVGPLLLAAFASAAGPVKVAPIQIPERPLIIVPAGAIDKTPDLKALQQAVRRSEAGPLPPEARLHRFLFVPGFSWDALPDYFGPNRRRLQQLGLETAFVPTDPLGTPQANAEAVRKALLASEKPAVIIGHSKGGVDSLVSLLRHPELQPRVSAFVALQTPYAGTAVADFFLERPLLYTTAMAYSRFLNPARSLLVSPFSRLETVREMSRERRGGLAGVRPALDRRVRLFSIATRVSEDTKIKLLLWVTAGTVKAITGKDSDGIVSPEDAVIPGSSFAVLEHVGHIDTVADPSSWRHKIIGVRGHDRVFAADLTEAVVRWIFADSHGKVIDSAGP